MGRKPALYALLFGLAIFILCVTSPARITGDGAEYLALADGLAHVHRPAVHVWHFWLFPALVVPFIWIFAAKPLLAFTLVNASFLVAAFVCVQRRAGPLAAIAVCAGPILWWIDKAQVEVFTVSLLAIGCACIERRGRAALAFALASTQNPPIAALAITLFVERLIRNPRSIAARWQWWALSAILCALGPVYYLRTIGRLTPLVPVHHVRLPGVQTMATILIDSNIGLLPNAPVTAVLLLTIFVAALRRPDSRMRLLFAAGAFALFLAAFAQAPNINSGGTPDMSRYALWLIPLAIAVWPREWRSRIERASVAALVGLSVLWAGVFFRPSLDEHYLSPTRLATWLWTAHPSWENPLPEVFAERLRHQDGVNTFASTTGCEKALVQEGRWPAPCAGAPVPVECQGESALCYANRTGDGSYTFVPTSRRGGVPLRR